MNPGFGEPEFLENLNCNCTNSYGISDVFERFQSNIYWCKTIS